MTGARSKVPKFTTAGNLETRLAQLKKEVPSRGVERLPSVLQSLSDLPFELQSSALPALASKETILTIIAFPPQLQRGWHYVPKQALLFTPTGLTHVTASIWLDQAPEVTSVDARGLLYLRATLLLLYGFLEIVVQGRNSPKRIGMEFNTVAWETLSRPLRRLLTARTAAGMMTGRIVERSAVQAALADLPLKFSNGVKLFVSLPGEELESLLFQPGLWSSRKSWPFFFRKPISADTLLSLTSNYLVVIQEEPRVGQGWIVSYIPRSRIVEIRSQPHGLWNELAVQVRQGKQAAEVSLPLRSEAALTWRGEWLRHGGRWQDLPDETGKSIPENKARDGRNESHRTARPRTGEEHESKGYSKSYRERKDRAGHRVRLDAHQGSVARRASCADRLGKP